MGTLTYGGTRRLVVPLLAGLLLLCVLTVPASAAEPTMTLSRSTVIGGESVRVTGFVGRRVERRVRLQRKVGSTWVTVKTRRTNARGRFSFRFRPTATVRVRVHAPRARADGKVRRARTTGSRTIRLVEPTATISAPPAVVQGATFVVSGSFTPARPGRGTLLQRLVGSTWTTLAAGTQSTTGRTTFAASSATTGGASLRVLAQAAGGAPVVASRTVTVMVQPPPDTTAPSVPTGLQATGHDASVALSWSAVDPVDDLAGYRVYRAPGPAGPWTKVTPGPGAATSIEVTGLTNDIQYHFTVTSIDTAGNESVRPPAVAATPTAGPDLTPPPAPNGLVAVAGARLVDLSWEASAAGDVAGYTVYTSTDPVSGPWTKVPGGLVAGTATTVTGLANGTTYHLAVVATDTAGNDSVRSAAAAGVPHDPPAVVDHCGTLPADQTWRRSSVHLLGCSVVVPAGVTLRLDPGTVVKAGAGTSVIVDGVLDALGTPQDPVTVTSLRDDTAGGDTNADGESTSPAAGDWTGVSVRSGGYADLDGTTLAHASTALSVSDGGGAAIHGAVKSSTTGVSSTTYVDATGVDWGDPSGPWPTGSGTPISGSTIDALPWTGWVAPAVPPSTPPTTTPDVDAGCRQLMFLGVRGSGESPYERSDDAGYASWQDGLGARVTKVHDGFDAAMTDGGHAAVNRKLVGLRYRALHPPALSNLAFASPTFTASIWEGVDRITQYLADEHDRCGTTQKYVLAGYSQGALAIHLYLTQRAPAHIRNLIAAVGLVADPARNGNGAEHVFTDGFVPPLPESSLVAASGTYARAQLPGGGPLPSDVADRTASVCHLRDVVCAPGWGASSATHINYDMAGSEMADLGAWLARTAIAAGLPVR